MAASIQVVLATHNPHKVEEFQALINEAGLTGIEIVAYNGPEPVEDGVTFQQNAAIKAQTASTHTGLPAIADDSGIRVDVLGGAPGVFSAYWAGHAKADAANRDLLLDQLSDVGFPHRGAEYVAVLALQVPDETVQFVEGVWRGSLAFSAAGTNGFGYDPIFVPEGADRTVGEYSAEEKRAESHRARAFAKLVPLLQQLTDA